MSDDTQGTEAWMQSRCGYFGASELGALMAKGEGKMRAALIKRKVAERLSGKPQTTWGGNAATENGHEQEHAARRAYEDLTGAFVEQAGFGRHPVYQFSGASPDGLVGDKGGVEFKSHMTLMIHLDAIESKMSGAHVYQCQWGMACWSCEWWDYAHWCPDAPENLRLFMVPRVQRDDQMIATLANALITANDEVNSAVERYRRMGRS